MRRRHLLLASLAAPLAAAPADAAPARRLGLVIGNDAYADAPLRTAREDGRRVGSKLLQLRYRVGVGRNLQRKPMHMALYGFAEQLQPADLVVVYYSGHALQVAGRNYLVPVGLKFDSMDEQAARTELISVDRMIERFDPAQRSGVIVLLDACRPNPMARMLRVPGTGLAAMTPPPGTLIAMAAEPDTHAFDSNEITSPFATALLEALDMRGIEIGELIEVVRRRVAELTTGEQKVWSASALKEPVVLSPAAA